MYRDIHKLPLLLFIEILTTKNYSLLVISGTATEAELLEAWELIYTQYTEAVGGKEMLDKIESVKDAVTTQSRVTAARNLITVIQIMPTLALVEQLYEFDYPLPELDMTKLDAILKVFTAHYKSEYMDLQIMAAKSESEQGKEIKIDFEYFFTTVVDMSNAFKHHININLITVSEYCIYINRYKQYCATLQKSHHERAA